MTLVDFTPELIAMAALMAASGFFSCSEAALFSLSRSQRTAMANGSDADRRAVDLLERPDRLLTAILFWNLVINMTYFALASVVTFRLARAVSNNVAVPAWSPQAMTIGSLAAIILASELLPKNLGVSQPRLLSALLARPLGVTLRVLDPLLPILQAASNVFARLLFPKLAVEPNLELSDLERAVQLGSGETLDSEALLIQERQVLQRLVELADTSIVELMRPRRRCLVLRPPITLGDLTGVVDSVGEYLLVTEPDTEEIAAAVPLDRLGLLPPDHLERSAEPVVYVPWCASAADSLSQLRKKGRRVAVVLNELGETIGMVPVEQLLDAVLRDASRPNPDDVYAAQLRQTGPAEWEASGATPLRRIAKRLDRWSSEADATNALLSAEEVTQSFIDARSRTVGGLMQELLERAPQQGDQVACAGLELTVTEGPTDAVASDDAPLVVKIEPASSESSSKIISSDLDYTDGPDEEESIL